ncbi:MAG: hypothetical protein RLN72_00410 [Henriciella sp.]
MAVEDGLHPKYPIVEGDVPLTARWQITLPQKFNQRIEDGTLVLWRPGLTVWLNAYGTEDGMSIDERIARDRANASDDAVDMEQFESGGVTYLIYRLDHEAESDASHSLYGFAHATDGQIIAAFYFDNEAELSVARAIAGSLRLK